MTRVGSGGTVEWCDVMAAIGGLWTLANLGLVDQLLNHLSCVYMYSYVHSPNPVVVLFSQILRYATRLLRRSLACLAAVLEED
jgi:hypothetical protein